MDVGQPRRERVDAVQALDARPPEVVPVKQPLPDAAARRRVVDGHVRQRHIVNGCRRRVRRRRWLMTRSTGIPVHLDRTRTEAVRQFFTRVVANRLSTQNRLNTFQPSVPKIATQIHGFNARLANRSLLVFNFPALWRSTLSARVPESQKAKNDRLASLVY